MESLLREGRPLGHAEAVLFVRHHEAEVPEGDRPREEGVGADGKVDVPRRQGGVGLPLRLHAGGARQQGAADA